MSLYEDKSNLKNLAIMMIIFNLIFNVIMTGYILSSNQITNRNDYIGRGLDTIFGETLGQTGRYNAQDELTRRTTSSLTCTPEDSTCSAGLLATSSIQNTGFDPSQEQINWGKLARLLAELAAMCFLPIRYIEPLTYLAGGTQIASFIIQTIMIIWQFIIPWAFWKAIKG